MSMNKLPTIMLVDDDRVTKRLLRSVLERAHYPVISEASSGSEAILRTTLLKPNVILLDINMPKMDGIAAIEEMLTVSPASMILMISSESTSDKVSEAIKKGAKGFLVKPINPATILDKLRSCWEKHLESRSVTN